MASLRIRPSREASKQNRPRTRQQTMLQKSVESLDVKKKHTGQNYSGASCHANYLKSSTIELNCPSFAVDCLSELYELFLQGICCDVILSTGDCQTSAHKVILMASSEYFKSLFLGSKSASDFIVLPSGVSGNCLPSLIRFMYVGTLYLNSENIQFMLQTATQLMVKPAINLCQKFMSENEHLFAVVGISPFAAENLENNLDQLTEVKIKEEFPFFDDVPNVESSQPVSNVKSDKSSSSIDATQIKTNKTKLSRDKSVTYKTRNKRRLDKNHLKQKKQRESTLPKVRNKKNTQPLVKRVVLSSSLSRHSKGSPLGTFRHQSLSSGTLQKCHICGSGFKNFSGLFFHRKSCHSLLFELQKSKLARNLRCRSVCTKLRSPSCTGDPTGDSLSEASHIVKWLCPLCHCQFSRSSHCRAHILKLHCKKLKKLKLRRIKLHPRCSTRERVFKCPLCRQPFVHLANLRKHCAANHPKTQDCKKFLYGKKKVKSIWHCQQNDCGTICRSAEQVKQHMATEHPAVLFSCPDCKFMSQVERNFLRHRAQRHGKTMMCHICGKGCYKLYLLRQHMYVHHNIRDPKLKLFQCSQEGCKYECSSKKRLEDHLKRHTLTKSLSCDVCGKGFKHSIGLERHKSAIHQGIRPYICDQCGIGFGLEHELKNHIARHSNNKPHACDQCPYRTYDKINLQSHLFSQHKIQTNRRIVIFRCDQCSFTSNRKGRYDDHLKKHQNIKDIPCPECGKLFHSKRNLYGHTVKVHRPKTLRCPHCNFSTAIRSKFNEHMQKKHIRSPMLAAAKQSSEVEGSG